jgi:hypothetical protein
LLFGLLRTFGDARLEILHGLTADGKFDEMKRHDIRALVRR